MKIIFISCV